MILLDTNILSEANRAASSSSVRQWLDAQPSHDLYLCAPVLAELRYGVERLPRGARRDRLELWIEEVEEKIFQDRILAFDRAAAHEFGRIVSRRVKMGRPIGPIDALIAAIAVCHGAAVATRDTNDFANLGLELINPFEPADR